MSYCTQIQIELSSNSTSIVSEGDSIEIKCPLSFNQSSFFLSWYKNGDKLSTIMTNNRFQIDHYKIKINNFFSTDSGLYNCELITGNGKVVQSAYLRLYGNNHSSQIQNVTTKRIEGYKPEFINSQYPLHTNIYEYKTFELDCLATGFPKPSVLWYKNGRVISEEEYGIVRNLMVFKFKKVFLSDSGEYRCQVYNKLGEINRYFKINVARKEKVTINHNNSVKLNCSNDKSDWYVKYKNKEFYTTKKIILSSDNFFLHESDSINNNILFIKHASLLDSGLYFCYNKGKINSKVYDLEVHGFSNNAYQFDKTQTQINNSNLIFDYPLPVIIIIILSLLSVVLIMILTLYYFVKLRKSKDDNVDNSIKKYPNSDMDVNLFKTRRVSNITSVCHVPNYAITQPIFRSQIIRPAQSTPQYYHFVRNQDMAYNNNFLNHVSYQSTKSNLSSIARSNSYRSCSKF